MLSADRSFAWSFHRKAYSSGSADAYLPGNQAGSSSDLRLTSTRQEWLSRFGINWSICRHPPERFGGVFVCAGSSPAVSCEHANETWCPGVDRRHLRGGRYGCRICHRSLPILLVEFDAIFLLSERHLWRATRIDFWNLVRPLVHRTEAHALQRVWEIAATGSIKMHALRIAIPSRPSLKLHQFRRPV